MSGVTNYKLFRGTTSGSYTQIASNITGTSYTDTTITNGTAYYYIVKAFNGTDSPNSNEAAAQTISSFTIASTTGISTSSIEVTWNAAAGASSYDILYGTVSGTYTTISNVISPYTITGLSSGTNYFIAVMPAIAWDKDRKRLLQKLHKSHLLLPLLVSSPLPHPEQ